MIDKAGLALAALILIFWVAPKLYRSMGKNPPITRTDSAMIFGAWVAVFGMFAACIWGLLK